ncbi:MAG TPA: TolC family protein, partial [Rubrobacter sp.]|nr:TolC family protein [Rubrobacter sp.]
SWRSALRIKDSSRGIFMTTQRGSLFLLVALVSLVGLNPLSAAETQERHVPSMRKGAIDAPRLALQELIAEAQRANPKIQAARARVDMAQARIPQARALPDPMVSVGYTNEGFSRLTLGSLEDAALGVSVSQEIPYPPKLALKGKVSAQERQREDERFRGIELDIMARLKVAYYELFLVERALDIVAKHKALLEQMAQTAEARYAVGRTVQQDVLRAHTEITILLQRLAQLEQQRGSLRAALNSLLNRPPPSPLGRPEEPLKRPFTWTVEQLMEVAVAGSPNLQAAGRLIDRQRLQLDLARQEYLPDFAVSVGYENRGRFEGMWQVMVGATVPLYFRTKQNYGVREAVAGLAEAEHDRQAVQQALFFEIKDLVLMAQTSGQLIELIGTGALPQARLTLESALASYAVGKVDFLSLLTNLLNVLNQELQYAQELSNFAKALANLERVVGVAF